MRTTVGAVGVPQLAVAGVALGAALPYPAAGRLVNDVLSARLASAVTDNESHRLAAYVAEFGDRLPSDAGLLSTSAVAEPVRYVLHGSLILLCRGPGVRSARGRFVLQILSFGPVYNRPGGSVNP